MKIKTNELTGVALDWAVGLADGRRIRTSIGGSLEARGRTESGHELPEDCDLWMIWTPSTRWSQGGSLVEESKINLISVEGEYNPQLAGTAEAFSTYWVAEVGRLRPTETYGPQGDAWGDVFQIDACDAIAGPTPLIAAMRCFCRAKLGEFVEVPDNLV